MSRIDINTDPVDWGDDLRLEYQGEPYTGEVVETLGDQLLSQEFYVNGVRHGPSRKWWADGHMMSEGEMVAGSPSGIFRKWHHNGRVSEEDHFDENGMLTVRHRWDEEGNSLDDNGFSANSSA
ncbi:hypothetical protein C8258_30375 [Nocardia sp. MDA0666]|uniref:toxin-antitoxin system YwqK family antitoxin n=1 Tax=Nocardia sp. MDA0666 TaxID=2135448 RepID=UPI000D11681B|nr:hypothetical protein [Nocardia sp. MDA0666]PSR58973.1 hypothetical protein C8258_30375 [Nocardia sp. MDA0666]